MRKKVIVLVSLLFVLVDMYAQTFYYDTTQVFYGQRYSLLIKCFITTFALRINL